MDTCVSHTYHPTFSSMCKDEITLIIAILHRITQLKKKKKKKKNIELHNKRYIDTILSI